MKVTPRYESALKRNLAELQKALLIRATLLGIEKHSYTAKVFTRVIHDSLHNDYMSHAIKVFEQSSKSASFWYLYRTDSAPIDTYSRQVGYDISSLQAVTDKLKTIRNGSHFHIDHTGVLDSKTVWSGASLTGKELGAAIDFAWDSLGAIQRSKGVAVPSLLDYTPDHALAALKRVEAGEP
jgi:hypothetical protein